MSKIIVLPSDMDPECISLCSKLNELDGIETVESCCGHLKNTYDIWFTCQDFVSLAILSRAVDKRYAGTNKLWVVLSETCDNRPTYHFRLKCSEIHNSHEDMLEDTEIIAENIDYWKNNFYDYFKTNGQSKNEKN